MHNRRFFTIPILFIFIVLFISSYQTGINPNVLGVQNEQNVKTGNKVVATNTPTLTPTPTSVPNPIPISPIISPHEEQKTSSDEAINFIMDAINNFRLSKGLSKISPNELTCNFAQIRAKEISVNFSHVGFDERAQNNSLPYSSYSKITENLAENTNYKKYRKYLDQLKDSFSKHA